MNIVSIAMVAIGFRATYLDAFLNLVSEPHAILATAKFRKTSSFIQDQQLFSGQVIVTTCWALKDKYLLSIVSTYP